MDNSFPQQDTPMSIYDFQLGAVAEPGQGVKTAGGPRADDPAAPLEGGEGYSPETLAALLEGSSPAVW
jgi:hypothetical protein